MLHVVHLNHNQLQPQLNSYGSRRKLCAVCLAQNFANFHLTAQDKFMQNASSKRDATNQHTHAHTLGAHLTQFICHKLRVMFLISAAGSGFSPPPPHTQKESKKINELSLSKSSDLIRQKKDYTFFGGEKDLRAAK